MNIRLITPGVDFYTFIHKSFRSRLFDASRLAGQTDWTDTDAAACARRTVEQLFSDLEDHARHEDEFWHPLISRVNSDALRVIDTEHVTQKRQIEDMQALLEAASGGDVDAGAEFYRAFNAFLGDFLLHLAEEEKANPLLWAVYRGGELEDAYGAFKLSIPVEESMRYLETMLPAMNPQDRAAFFAGLAGAPEPLIDAVRSMTMRLLGESAWVEPAVAA